MTVRFAIRAMSGLIRAKECPTLAVNEHAMASHPGHSAASASCPECRGHTVAWPLGLAAVLLIVAGVYAPTLNDFFGGDDFLVIGPVQNMGPWELIGKSIILRDNIVYWRPLVSPLYALEVHGFGLRPWAYHAIALGLHLANVVLLALIALTLTGRRRVALAAGLLFGVHAAHTTTVAQISSTVELLSVVWYLMAVWCAVRWATGPRPAAPDSGTVGRRGWYLASLGAFGLALLAKESTASAAGVITVLFFLFVLLPRRRWRRFVLAALPFWALVLPYTAFTFVTNTDDPSGIVRRMYFPGPHVGQNMWWFLARLAAPLENGHGPYVSVAGHLGAAVLLIAALGILAWGSATTRFLVLWTGIALTPLAPWRPDLLLGRFTYQASAPFAILLALAGAWLVARAGDRLPGGAVVRLAGPALILAAVAVLGTLTIVQNRERTREGEMYRLLVRTLQREFPSLPPTSEVVLIDGPWTGPFHARYLQAVAETLYGPNNVRIVNVEPGTSPESSEGKALRMQYRHGLLTRLE